MVQDHDEQLRFLASISDTALIEICKFSLEYLKDHPNHEKYAGAAQSMCTTPENIEQLIEANVFFLLECVLVQFPNERLSELGFSENKIEILRQFVQKEQDVVRRLVAGNRSTLRFRDMDWRLETVVASRALHDQMTPMITLKLHLDSTANHENKEKIRVGGTLPNTQRQMVMQMDPGSLRSIIEKLDEALQESKSHRTRLLCRAFQK